MKRLTFWFSLLIAAGLMAGCANQKEPAAKAIADVQASINAVRADAAIYAAPELEQAESGLVALQESFTKGDFKGVVAAAPGIQSQVASLTQTVNGKKAEMEAANAAARQQWDALSGDVPKMVEAIQSRVDILGKSRKLPKNVTAEGFQAAKDGLEWMKTTWGEATNLFSQGSAADAVTKAQSVKDKGTEVMQLLAMA